MAQNSNKKTKFIKSKSVVTDDFLNSMYGGLKGTEMESVLGTADPLIGGHVHDGVSADGHAQKINLGQHVTGKLPISMIQGTITASAADPEYSIQFNQSSLLAGSESFVFNTSDNSPVLKQDAYFYFGTADSGVTVANHIRLAYSTVDSTKALVFSRNASDSSDPSLSISMDDFRTLAVYPLNQNSTNNLLGKPLNPWTSSYFNKLFFTNYNNDSSTNTISIQVSGSIAETQVLNLPSTKPSINQYLKAESVAGSTVNLTWDTASGSAVPGTPTNSFQFNSTDTSFSGTETFYFEPSSRNIVLAKDHRMWFGSTDSSNSFWLEHEVDGSTPVLEFYASNSVDSEFAFKNGAAGTTDVYLKLKNNISYFYTTGTGFLGKDSSGDLFKWDRVITDGLSLYHNDTTADTKITLNASGNLETYNLELPKLKPTTVDMFMRVVQYGASTELTWDTSLVASTIETEFFQAVNIITNSFSGNTVDFDFGSVDSLSVSSTLETAVLTIGGAYTLPTVDGLSNYILKTNGSGSVTWTVDSSGISNLAADTSPQLGGTLDANGKNIDMGINTITDTAVGNWNTAYGWGDHSTQGYLTTDTTVSAGVGLVKTGSTLDVSGTVNILNINTLDVASLTISSVYTFPTTDGSANYILKTNGSGSIIWTVDASGISGLVEDTSPQLGGTLDSNGNNIDMGVNVITDSKVGQWDTAYGWGDHSLQGYLTVDTIANVGSGLVKTGSTIDISSSQNLTTVDIISLSINSSYTFPTVDGSAGYVLKTDGSGGVSWADDENEIISAGFGLTKTGSTIDVSGTINTLNINTLDVASLAINSNYTFPAVDGSPGYILVTDGSGGVSWAEQDSFSGGQNIVITGSGTVDTASDILVNSIDASSAQIDSLNINGNYTLPTVDGTTGYVLKTDGSGSVSWQADLSGIGTVEVINDTTPQLGGNLDLNSRSITGMGTINISGNILGESLTSSDDLITQGGIHEKFSLVSFTIGTAVVTHDSSNGHVFYHASPVSNFTANFTNVDLLSGYATSFTIIMNQGSSGFIPNGVQINGSSQTINWQGGLVPTGSSSTTDVINFSVLYDGVNYIVLGQLIDF